jgi:hypothetical protein
MRGNVSVNSLPMLFIAGLLQQTDFHRVEGKQKRSKNTRKEEGKCLAMKEASEALSIRKRKPTCRRETKRKMQYLTTAT